jgi:hypothetical protein
MNAEQLVLTEQATPDHRLIRDHSHTRVHPSELRKRGEGSREELELIPRLDVVLPPAVDDPITIEEDD